MKLLMENWRHYLAESEKAQDYGHLYLFEDNVAHQTSFYDALNLLNESESDIEIFLEKWEKSVDYQIGQLDEAAMAGVASNPVLYLSTQAFMLIDKLKDKVVKYASKILGVVNKVRGLLSRFKEKNPTLYKIGSVAIKVVVAMIVVYAISSIFGGGEAHAGDVVGMPEFEGGEIVQKVIASEDQLRQIGEAAKQVEGLQDVAQELLDIANNPQNVEGGSFSTISDKAQRVIRHGIDQLGQQEGGQAMAHAAGQVADNLPEVTTTVTQTTITNAPLQALNALMGVQMGDQESLELLQQLQSQIPQLKGVDISSLTGPDAARLAKQIKAAM